MSTRPGQPADPATVPQCLSIKQLMQRTGLGRTLISQALSRGDLEHFRVGGRALIPAAAAAAWLETHRITKRPRLWRRQYLLSS